jgi:soluble lytic murein transglycosylase-like protein
MKIKLAKCLGIFLIIMIALAVGMSISDIKRMPPILPGDPRLPVLQGWIYLHSTRISMATAQSIARESLKYKNCLLLLAVASVESEFNPSVISYAGAFGLMQIIPKHWEKELITQKVINNSRDLFDVGPSFAAGNFILKYNMERTRGNLPKALEMYLGGKDGVYVKKILSNFAELYFLVPEMKP